MKQPTIKGWAVYNWTNTAIVNDGAGQKRIYRLKSQANEAANRMGYGTHAVAVLISPLKPRK